jgi:hypothetical protein
MSTITLTELAKRRLMGDAIPSEVKPDGGVYVPYDSIRVYYVNGKLCIEMLLKGERMAKFEQQPLQLGSSLTVTGLEGKMRVHYT